MSVRLSHEEILRFAPEFNEMSPLEQCETIDRLEHDPKVRDTLYNEVDDNYERVRADPNASLTEMVTAGIKKIVGEWRFGS